MRFHPKKYVKPSLSQQFLSKELENLQPKTVIEKINFSVWFLFRQWLFCRTIILLDLTNLQLLDKVCFLVDFDYLFSQALSLALSVYIRCVKLIQCCRPHLCTCILYGRDSIEKKSK